MADLHEYTTKEVLNKVLLDSSGNAVAAYSHTSQEALNAVLDSTNSRLNVSLVGGTISGDVTISGDLTVTGDSAIATNEVIQGTSIIDVTSTEAFLVRKDSDGGDVFVVDTTNNKAIVGVVLGSATHPSLAFGDGNTGLYEVADNTLAITTLGSERMRINNVGDVGIGGGTNSNIKVYIQDSTDSASAWATSIYQGGAGGNGLRVDVASTDASDFIFQAGANNGGTQVLNVMADGKVGIGTNSISSPLHLKVDNNNSDPHFFIENANNGGRSHARFYNSSRNTYWSFGQQNDDSFVFANHSNINSSQKFIIDANSRISLSNNTSFDSGTDNTVFGYQAGNNIASGGNQNTFIGDYAGHSNTTGDDNTYIGKSAGQANSGTGDDNTFVGSYSGYQLTGGSSNTAVGTQSLVSITSGDNNTALGRWATGSTTTGSGNVALGYVALYTPTTTVDCVAIGNSAMYGVASGQAITGAVAIGKDALLGSGSTTTGINYTVAIGHSALKALTTGTTNVAIGHQALYSLTIGSNNVAIGKDALLDATEGVQNIAIGFESAKNITIGDNNIAIGREALATEDVGDRSIAIGTNSLFSQNSDTDNEDAENVAVGIATGYYNVTGQYNTYIGNLSGYGASGQSNSNNTAIGYKSLFAITTGDSNVALGYNSGRDVTSGNKNIFIGEEAGMMQTTGSGSVNIGHNVGRLDSSSANVIIGHLAFSASNNSSSASNVILGFESATGINSASSEHNVIIGRGAGTGGGAQFTKNIAIGSYALDGTGANAIEGTIAIGYQALSALTSGGLNTAVGYEAGKSMTDNDNNTIMGYQAFKTANSGENNNTVIGVLAGSAIDNAVADGNVLIGKNAGVGGSGAMNGCIYIGNNAGENTHPRNQYDNVFIGNGVAKAEWGGQCDNNVGIGSGAMSTGNLNGANNNVALGKDSLKALTTGSDNVVLGYNAMYRADQNAGGTSNMVVIGSGACSGTWTNYTSSNQVVIGKDAMNGALNGTANNVVIGYAAGQTLTTGQNNTLIGASVDVDDASRAGCIIIGKGLSLNTASDNVVEIGNDTNSMTYDLDGGDITVTSDVRTKKNIKETKIGLEFINKLRPITYQTKSSSEYPKEFKVENPSKKSSGKTWDGLIAQEVKEVMDEMNVGFSGWEEGINTKQRLAYGKFVMPLIKAVQELSAKVEELEAKLSK